ncbi:hypothetical protein [Photobacterium sanguinicancri]|uniref:hypothetical protein n=1 Tax=Photobacterium sanguinicancri TaxID=875932 RepID=UPI0026E28407|nr:hypothetical protein [Photobacterium sanguinicancri]MDO6496723.1 hypothetical protein [Photobacterium sanguinicancri]
MMKVSVLAASIIGLTLSTVSWAEASNATWVATLGFEQARTVTPTKKKDAQQVETILHGANVNLLGLTWANTIAAKWNREGQITVARNWAYGYWNDNFGLSVDLIKGKWRGQGANIGAVGLAYKDCWGDFCLRVNPTIASIDIHKPSAAKVTDNGAQLNLKMNYQITDRINVGFHPQYAYWRSDALGSTLKLDINATFNITEDKRHKLTLLNESFVVKNRASDMKTRFVGEGTPLAGYIPGTESTYKLRYTYIF